ncbi:amino acid transporter [Desulfosporosinus acidiphilus SJ4]|uniref:Amino acid transporter n=1 Tax=Desulfosporosinus acidiphilus (strain DSM 22704 / JCM 16185 / SJ4) TaxID=646529 RepID=I4D736_DESAJ|nr:APC family permease [Desulfosporosinus acidiphilus]AFM41610.1 amino acid transporter [Desulfosporosinus acidiphilus SJ4]
MLNHAGVEVPRLKKNALSLSEIVSSSLANVAPAMCIYFSLSLIVGGAGIAAPLTVLLAAVAMAFHANAITEFTKALPSTGSYVTFIGKSFGRSMSVIVALMYVFSYIVAIGSVITMSGYWTAEIIKNFLNIQVPWWIISVLFVLLVYWVTSSGIKLSVRTVVTVFAFEVGLLLISAIAMLIAGHAYISFAPLNPANIKGGLSGVGLGFPIAIFMFIGVGNSAPLAEETENPRRNVPLAVYTTVIVAGLMYTFLGYATIIGLHANESLIANASVPFIDASKEALGGFVILAYLAGFTSTLACLIGATNGQSRVIFSSAREGLLPKWLAGVSKKQTPVAAIRFYLIAACLITFIWSTKAAPLDVYGFLSTLGAIGVILIYITLNFALTTFYKRQRADKFKTLKHGIVPAVSTLTMLLPLWGLIQPGQPTPYNIFPYLILAYLVVVVVYALVATRRNPELGRRVGSVVADE